MFSIIPNFPHLTTLITESDSLIIPKYFPFLPNLKHVELGIINTYLPLLPNSLEILIIHSYESIEPLDLSVFSNLTHIEINPRWINNISINLDDHPNLISLISNTSNAYNVSYSNIHHNITNLHPGNDNFIIEPDHFPKLINLSCGGTLHGDIASYPNIEYLAFSDFHGEQIDISKFNNLRYLHLTNCSSSVITWPGIVDKLEYLTLCGFNGTLTNKMFPTLKEFRITNFSKVATIKHETLEHLSVQGSYKAGSITVSDMGSLKSCNINDVKNITFRGIFRDLETLECDVASNITTVVNLDNMRRLSRLKILGRFTLTGGNNTLESITFDRVDYDLNLSYCMGLKWVFIEGMNIAGSVRFGKSVMRIGFLNSECEKCDTKKLARVMKKLDTSRCKNVELFRI